MQLQSRDVDIISEYLAKHYSSRMDEMMKRPFDRNLRIEMSLRDIGFFARFYLSHHFYDELAPVHHTLFDDMHGMIVTPGPQYLLEVIFRGAGKTTISTLATPLWCVALAQHLAERARHCVTIMSDSQSQAREQLRTIKYELENNERLREDFGDLQGERWRTDEIETKHLVAVKAFGSGTAFVGTKYLRWRPDLIILDDIEDRRDVLSETQRDHLARWLNRDVLPAGAPDAKVVAVGNIIHYDCLLNKLKANPLFHKRRVFSVIPRNADGTFSFSENQALWERWGEIITNQGDELRYEHAMEFYREREQAMLVGAESSWPARFSYYDLMVLRKVRGEASFNAEMLNDPVDPERRFFKRWHHYRMIWDYEERGKTEWLVPWNKENNRPSGWPAVPLNECTLFAATDPSLGKRTTAHPSCILVLAKAPSNQLFVLHVDKAIRPPSQIIMDQNRIWRQYPQITRWTIESVQFQEFFAEEAGHRALEETGRGLPLVPGQFPVTQKPLRIQSLQADIDNGYILFPMESNSIIQEMEQYPFSSDDALDTLCMARSLARDYEVAPNPGGIIATTYSFGEGEQDLPFDDFEEVEQDFPILFW